MATFNNLMKDFYGKVNMSPHVCVCDKSIQVLIVSRTYMWGHLLISYKLTTYLLLKSIEYLE